MATVFPDVAEYAADTDPLDPADFFRILAFATSDSGATVDVAWTSRPSRQYRIETRPDFFQPWTLAIDNFAPDPGTTTSLTLLDVPDDQRFYRIHAFRPLTPP